MEEERGGVKGLGGTNRLHPFKHVVFTGGQKRVSIFVRSLHFENMAVMFRGELYEKGREKGREE